MMRCPYGECSFDGTVEEVEDHVTYLQGVGDPEHEERSDG